jgi:hypothetical protein
MRSLSKGWPILRKVLVVGSANGTSGGDMPQYKQYTWHFEMEADTSDERARGILDNMGLGGMPKTDIQIEERPSHVEGMAVFVFTYTAPIPGT